MLERDAVVNKMTQRGFTVYATIGQGSALHFVSQSMYEREYVPTHPRSDKPPTINVLVYLLSGEFKCWYNIPDSMNQIITPSCSPVMNDEHFDKIVGIIETQAKWMARLG